MRDRTRAAQVLLAVAVLALGCVGVALVAQYQFDMQPCVWCVLQRLIYIVIGFAALVAAAFVDLRAVFAGLATLAAVCGIAASLWQQFYAAKQPSCLLTLADRIITFSHLDRLLPQVFVAYASCADAAVDVLGVPFALWSCAMFALLAALCAATLRAGRRR